MTSLPVSPPVPKPRSRYRNSLSSATSASDREEPDPVQTEDWNRIKGLAFSSRDSSPSAEQAPSPSDIANSIAANIPCLAAVANGLADPRDGANLENMVGSFSDVQSLAGLISNVANAPRATPPAKSKPRPVSAPVNVTPGFTDVNALSNLVKSVLEPAPAAEAAGDPEASTQAKVEYLTLLSHWTSLEEVESESSNEEEEPATATPPGRPAPSRPAPPPPNQSQKPQIPRAATLRVSRKKGTGPGPGLSPSVTRSSWLDVWRGFRHNVVWATFDGQVMALWKKRTDRFSEVMFHVSSITNIKKQDKGRFSVYFRKKHYDFVAHSDDVQNGWVSSLLSTRGCSGPAPPQLQGPITLKEPRSRAYGAVFGPELWVFPNKDSFSLGLASFCVQLSMASVKSSGKHSLSLITPFKNFSLSVDSSREQSVWKDTLSACICSSLGSSQVAVRLWDQNPSTKLCAECGSANPEWASVNLLLVVCHTCAGVHRSLGNLSKIRSLMMDNKVWTEALVQLFVSYGNRVANQIWAPVIPASEQLRPESSDEQRSKFIQDKYSRGRYRRLHALSSSQDLMDQRLREVVCADDVEETLSLICSGAKVTQTDLLSPAPIHLAEKAGQALQVELLRLNESTDVPPPHLLSTNQRAESVLTGEEEELHGKLEDDRFLFSLENDSAAYDVLDLREVHSVFLQNNGPSPQFQVQSLSGPLICAADSTEDLLVHYHHILKVILPSGVSDAEVGKASAVSKVCVVEMGSSSSQSEAWILLLGCRVSLHQRHSSVQLQPINRHEMDPSENTVTMETRDRSVSVRFEDQISCTTWFSHLNSALSSQRTNQIPRPSSGANQSRGLYPVKSLRGKVPVGIERCISHVTNHGLKVEGVYRRCGLTNKVARLVEVLMTCPGSAPFESDEQGVLDAAAALKRIVRQMDGLVPENHMPQWIQAAVISDERSRFLTYKELLKQLPDNSRATLSALFAHFYMVQVFSQVNRMSAQNLALVLVPTLFQILNQNLVRLLRDFIIHHPLLFLGLEEENEEVTFL